MNQYSAPVERVDNMFRARTDADRLIQIGMTGNDVVSSNVPASLSGYPQAMVYAPESTFTNIYSDEEGLCRGTVFADLYFPFEASCNGNGGAVR